MFSLCIDSDLVTRLPPKLVQCVEKDLLNIMARGTVGEEDGEENAHNISNKGAFKPIVKPDVEETGAKSREPERSESYDSDESM